MNTAPVNELIKLMESMSEKEQSALIEKIMDMMSTGEKQIVKKDSCHSLVRGIIGEKPDCPHCRAEAKLGFIIKKGMDHGSQRYYCKNCGKFFVSTTNTAFAYSRKSAETWKKFILLTLKGASLHICASECNIAYRTAFVWRHKVLNVFQTDQNTTTMSGIVEMDEMFFGISYKGNHVQGRFGRRTCKDAEAVNHMPRPAFERGTDNRSRYARDKICVFCMVEDGNKAFYAAVAGAAYKREQLLNSAVNKHVSKDSALVLIDDNATTRTFMEKNDYKFKTLLSNLSDNPADHKPQIEGSLHLQHVNAMHRLIRRFLKPYCGVSSKYLQNYVAMYIWLRGVNSNRAKQLEKVSVSRAAFSDCYITAKEINSYPRVPVCA